MRLRLHVRSTLVATLLGVGVLAVPSASATVTCDRVAAPTGSDSAAGTAVAPFRTARRLADATPARGTGCLRAGTYVEDLDVRRSDLTFTSYPDERATLFGRLYVARGADRVTFTGLNLNGRNAARLPSPTVNATDTRFIANDVTNDHHDICFNLGHEEWGRAVRTEIRGNRIHDCGRLPSTNYDHGIYVAAADDVQIIDNVIYDNADRGIQLYPDAKGTTVRGNIINGNGVGIIFSGASGKASSGNRVTGNVISGSKVRSDVESWYPAGNPVGTDNLVAQNCIAGRTDTSGGGFSVTGNIGGSPGYRDAAAGDFRVDDSACAGVLADSEAPAGPDWEAPRSGAAAQPTPESTRAPIPAPAPQPTPSTGPTPPPSPARVVSPEPEASSAPTPASTPAQIAAQVKQAAAAAPTFAVAAAPAAAPEVGAAAGRIVLSNAPAAGVCMTGTSAPAPAQASSRSTSSVRAKAARASARSVRAPSLLGNYGWLVAPHACR